jgi:hypothetical protein
MLQLTHGGFGLSRALSDGDRFWAQGPVGVTSGKHFFAVCVTESGRGYVTAGFADDQLKIAQKCLWRSSAKVRRERNYGTSPFV